MERATGAALEARAQGSCAEVLRRGHAQGSCAEVMRRGHAQRACAGSCAEACAEGMRRGHAQRACAEGMRRGHAQRACALRSEAGPAKAPLCDVMPMKSVLSLWRNKSFTNR